MLFLDINLTFLTAGCSLVVRSSQKSYLCNSRIIFSSSYLMNTEVEKLNLRAFDGHQDVKTYI